MMSANESTPDRGALLDKWHGQLVPWSYEGGFIALSFVVSLIGAATTLELIQRRTAQTGKLNNVLLVGAAISMGGVAIWSMHYVGNRSIIIADGESQIQISYSSSFTVLSLFVPIFVLLAAFVATGTKDRVSWWRIGVGGTLAGLAICGMHYLGNASISNYSCEYDLGNVIAAAVIAVVASSVALAIFFVFRATWTSAWWKRTISEIILAGAVSGMHWCASGGTHYRMIDLRDSSNGELDRNTTVIIVICLAVGASILMGAMAIYLAYIMKRYASRAQKIQLAAAVFDDQGRVLVNRDGLLPCEKITDSFFEKTPRDALSNAHPLFHWMYQVSRNWPCVAPLMEGMSAHLAQLSRDGMAKGGIQLVTAHHEPVQDYDNIIRELFCVTAATLAARLKINLEDLGVLWDEILNTGGAPLGPPKNDSLGLRRQAGDDTSRNPADVGLAEKGFRFRVEVGHDAPRGSLLFLVRKIQSTSDVEALEAAGFRFAELHQVSNNISTKMQIRTRDLEVKLRSMAIQTEQSTMLEPGVHLGLFGVRYQSGVVESDVMARKGATNLLPSVAMVGVEALEESEKVFLAQLDRMSINDMLHVLRNGGIPSAKDTSAFAEKLACALGTLRGWVDDPVLAEAMVTSKVVEVPSSPLPGTNIARTATMIALRIVIPPSHKLSDHSRCELVPLGLFRVQQIAYKGSPHQEAFAQSVRREIAPLIDHLMAQENSQMKQSSRNKYTKLESPRKDDQSETAIEIIAPGNSRPATPEKKLAMWKHWRKVEHASRDVEYGDSVPNLGSPRIPERLSSLSSGMASKRSNSSLSLWRGGGDRTNSIGDIRAVSPHGSVGGPNGALAGVTALSLPTCGKCGRHGGAPVPLKDDDDRVARRSCCSAAATRVTAAAPSNNNGNGSSSKSHGDVVEMTPLASPRSGHIRGDSGGAASLTSNGSVGDASDSHESNGSSVEAGRDISTFVDEMFRK